MTEEELEAERIMCVFGLGGGELSDEPWDGVCKYWYEGVPEYAEEFGSARYGSYDTDEDGNLWEYRTALLNELYGYFDTPPGWERLARYNNSGERDCWWCGPGTGNEDERDGCLLCEGDGYVYLGEGWGEVVFRRKEVEDGEDV